MPGNPDGNPPVPNMAAIQANGATVYINNAELYVPVDTLSINRNINFLEGFKRTISSNKYRTEITTQTKKQ